MSKFSQLADALRNHISEVAQEERARQTEEMRVLSHTRQWLQEFVAPVLIEAQRELSGTQFSIRTYDRQKEESPRMGCLLVGKYEDGTPFAAGVVFSGNARELIAHSVNEDESEGTVLSVSSREPSGAPSREWVSTTLYNHIRSSFGL